MKTSTVDDIVTYHKTLVREARRCIGVHKTTSDPDWWETITIGDRQFDLNIFDWETDDGKPMIVATAHPVTFDDEGYGTADMGKFVRLMTKQHGKVTVIGVR